jgi:hypothetical protein
MKGIRLTNGIAGLNGEILNFHSRVMGLYSSNCRRFFVCHAVNWEPLGQFTSNFAQLLELIVLQSVYLVYHNTSRLKDGCVKIKRCSQMVEKVTMSQIQILLSVINGIFYQTYVSIGQHYRKLKITTKIVYQKDKNLDYCENCHQQLLHSQ